MEIRPLEKESFAGKRFTARYRTKGYYDIRPSETGFCIQYAPFDTAVERSFEDDFFGEWLGESVAYGASDLICMPTPTPTRRVMRSESKWERSWKAFNEQGGELCFKQNG